MFNRKKRVNENQILIDQCRSINSEIKGLETQYGEYILSSLKSDESEFIKHLKSGGDERTTYWRIDNISSSNFTLAKYGGRKSGNVIIMDALSRISIDVRYRDDISSIYEIREASVSSKGVSAPLGNEFKEILLKYLLLYNLNKSESELEKTKASLNNVKRIIGDSVARDSKIEKILE
jgi:hypothetical protein